jgi:uroporphyrinogen-III synthase
MIDAAPLKGKKILVPRGKGQAKPFSDLVRIYGGIPVEIPLIAFRPIAPNEETKAVLQNLDTYDWIIFTSNVTVDTFFALGGEEAKERLPKVAVIGARTREILLDRGIPVEFTPSEYVAEGFVREFLPLVEPDMKVLIPKGNLARDYIAASLRAAGAQVTETVIYETYAPEDSKEKLARMLAAGELDILTFTSPSTVDHFMDIVSEYNLYAALEKFLVACIGPVTKKKAEASGLNVDVSPSEYTVDAMLLAIIEKLTQGARF